MTKLLEQALSKVEKLPASEQDAVAAIVMEELASEQRSVGVFREVAGRSCRTWREGSG